MGEKEKKLGAGKKKKIGEQSEPSSVVVPTTKLASLTVIFPTKVLHPFFLAFSPTTEPAWSQAIPTSNIYFAKFSEVINTINDTLTNLF